MSSTKSVSLWLKHEKRLKIQTLILNSEVEQTRKRQMGSKSNRKKHVLKLGAQIKMAASPERSGQFSFCSTQTLILFLILHFPLPLSPALEICPSAITSQSRPLLGFLCFAKANQCCSKATLFYLLPWSQISAGQHETDKDSNKPIGIFLFSRKIRWRSCWGSEEES